MKILLCFTIMIIFGAGSLMAQVQRVELKRLTMFDDDMSSLHVLNDKPPVPLRLPPGDNENRRFLKEFYSWKMTTEPDIIVMIVSKSGRDLLYIDRNMNHDLTDDGMPVVFPFNQDTVTFEITGPTDTRQRTKIMFARTLNYKTNFARLPDSSRSATIDKAGNLNPQYAQVIGMYKDAPDFTGTAGSFYFTERLSVRKGTTTFEGKEYTIGLHDWSNNGLFNDDDDLMLVVEGADAQLPHPDTIPERVFRLNDVFALGDTRSRVRAVDPYGTWIDLERTAQELTSHYREYFDSLTISSARKNRTPPEFLSHTAVTLDGDTLSLAAYTGKYLLLNFWSEWCAPCLKEIRALVEARKAYPDSLIQFVSFIRMNDKAKVQKIMADSGMTWPQIAADAETEKKYHVRGLPSNILILPDGKECVAVHGVNAMFFQQYVK